MNMNSSDTIGGYFQLELNSKDFLHSDAILLNSGRNCFEYILRANKAKHVYLPKFICDVMLEPLEKLDIPHTFYEINGQLEIKENISLKQGEFILYVDYFGVKDSYCETLIERYKDQVILDSSQAFYSRLETASHMFYSPRKFFGIPDGGMLYTTNKLNEIFETDKSYKRFSHLLKRIDLGAEKAYEDFKTDDKSLNNQPIRGMSKLTKSLLANIDFEQAKKKRINNFEFLHTELKANNKFTADLTNYTCPMVYPFQTTDKNLRKKLIDNKIFVATYWPNVYEWCKESDLEHQLAEQVLPLPIDQRYGDKEMKRIVDIINGN